VRRVPADARRRGANAAALDDGAGAEVALIVPPNGPVMRGAVAWPELLPALRAALAVAALFAAALLLAREYASPLRELLAAHAPAGVVVFVATSALAVLVPMLTNLPLVPLAVLAWGPWWTASLLLFGWVLGATLSFALARRARAAIVRRFTAVQRHAGIDRLIHPRHRLLSLVLLRMTFPVDVLSYALGLFSRGTTTAEVALSTLLGAAPFALLFALMPTLSPTAQAVVAGTSACAFALYVLWVAGVPGNGSRDR
jgi:uncharacterized membrane protein YdjX (TVP38/TMEM64 family)